MSAGGYVKIIISIFSVVAIVIVSGFGIGSSITTPNHAIVFVDENTATYLSPPCLPQEEWRFYPEMKKGDMKNLILVPGKACIDSGGFVQEGRSVSGIILESLGVLGPLKSRWNTDGSWNW
jgi:hypothetical protein